MDRQQTESIGCRNCDFLRHPGRVRHEWGLQHHQHGLVCEFFANSLWNGLSDGDTRAVKKDIESSQAECALKIVCVLTTILLVVADENAIVACSQICGV